jgi:AbrB family looped-hinge helix DNA binding protein
MSTRNVGPKGQIVIPKRIREATGMKPGAEVTLELRDDELVISKPKIAGNYTEYYISSCVPKLKKPINVKQAIAEEVSSRHALP